MPTKPIGDTQTDLPATDPGQPNPTRLPIEPEFGPVLEPVEPEDPGVKPPSI